VVTETEALGAEEPAPSFASTEKLNVVCAVSPFTVKLVPLAVPMELPFFKTVYPVMLQFAGAATAGQLKSKRARETQTFHLSDFHFVVSVLCREQLGE